MYKRGSFLILCLLIILCSLSLAFAESQSITNGLGYLTSTQNSDGSWGSDSSDTDILPATVSVIETLQILNQTSSSNYSDALLWLQTQGLNTTDYLSERIQALSVAGTDETALMSYIDQLSYAWGGYEDFDIDNLDTALALQALKKLNSQDQTTISSTISYLLSTQNSDGGFGFSSGDDGNVYMTATVVNTLSQFKTIYNLKTPIANGITYLLSKQYTAGGFGTASSTTYETSLVLTALINNSQGQAVPIQNAINYLTSTQLPNGSWDEDPYSTALALRALANVKPDLSISSSDISFSNAAPTIGDTITITANIHNNGPAEADNVLVQFYDGDPNAGGAVIGEATIPSVVAFASAPASITWTIPTASTQVVFVVVDPFNAIDELTNTDKTAYKPITSATLPDLSIVPADITFSPSSPSPADTVKIAATIRNLGETAANNFTVDIYDGAPAAGGTSLLSTTVPSLGGGSSLTLQLTGSFALGAHNIYVVIDKANSITESNKANDTAMTTFQVQLAATPDLAITNQDITFIPLNPTDGGVVTLSAVVHNIGDAAANNVLVRFYLGDPDAGGVQIGTDQSIASISARGASTVTTTWNTTGYAGNNSVYAKVDPLNTITEVTKLNNKAFTIITVTAQTGADLAITTPDLNINPLNPTEGNTVTITANVRNIGTADAANVLVEFSLGDPNVLGTLIIGSQTIPYIAKGGSAAAQLVWNTKGFAGTYEVYANANPSHTIPELNYQNNMAHMTLVVSEPQGPDLTVTSIDRTNLVTDTQSLNVSGSISVTIQNKGNQPTNAPFDITAFEDTDGNTMLDPGADNILGKVTYTGSLAAGASDTVAIPISGNVLFRDNLIYVMVDSGNAIQELDKTNNIRTTAQQCEYKPPVGQFNPVEKWKWTGSSTLPSYNQVIQTPIVARIADTNGDGVIDDKDVPAIIFVSYYSSYLSDGVLRAIRGDNGQEIFTVPDPAYRLGPSSTLAVGDIDNDGKVEIIGARSEGGIVAFANDGSVKWTSPYGGITGGLAIADIDHSGKPAIINGNIVLNNDGTLRWKGAGGTGSVDGWAQLSVVADLNLDGQSEIIAGNTVYRNDGTILFTLPANDGFTAVGNFNDGPYPEIVLVTTGVCNNVYDSGQVYLFDHTGNKIWGPVCMPIGGRGGAPTIADFDGSGKPGIGVAGAYRYVVIKSDGTILWQAVTHDYSSHLTGSSVFDFDGDGTAEAVYNDELNLYIFRGADGKVLFQTPNSDGTMFENPVIADVDNDGHAEIVVAANTTLGYGPEHGIRVFADANNTWVRSRPIWNQHSYHITNVNDDGSIPRYEENSWARYNTYRCNSMLADQALATPDITASYIAIDQTNYPASVVLTARIGNGGAAAQPSPVDIAFYSGDPQAGGVLIGTTSTTLPIAPGQYQDVSFTWANPSLGGSTVYVVADPSNKINECRKDNNISSSAGMADLAITPSDLSVTPPDLLEGQTATISATVHNIGGLGASGVAISFYNGDPKAGGILIGSSTAAFIAAGSSVSATVTWNTAGHSGMNYIYAIADPNNTIQESNKTNNSSFIPLNVPPPSKPDLLIASSDITVSNSNPEVQEQISVSAVVHNIGTAAGPVEVALYDGDPKAGGIVLADSTISGIIPFEGQATVSFNIQAPGPAGSHNLYVFIDPSNKIDESDKTNNIATSSITVKKSSFGLSVTTDKTSYNANENVQITVSVTNTSLTIDPSVSVTVEDSAGNKTASLGTFTPQWGLFGGWSYRIPAQISKGFVLVNATATAKLDFTQIFGVLGVSPWTLDTNSIRVGEVDSKGNSLGEKQAKAVFKGTQATVTWLLDGATAANTTRYFYIYFDILENGAKPQPVNTRGQLGSGRLIGFTDGVSTLYTVTNNGDGTFGPVKVVDTGIIGYDFGMAVADFNNDGFDDIIIGYGNGDLYYYQNKADGTDTFLPKQKIGTIPYSSYIMDMAVADFNSDGNLDFVVGGNDNVLTLFKGNGDGTFVQSTIPSPPTGYLRGKAAADFNGDGKMDLVVGSYGGAIYLYEGNGDGTFASPVLVATVGSDQYGVTAGDFNGDGNIDILVKSDGSGPTYLLKGNGDGTFGAPVIVSSLSTSNYTGLKTGDFNGDGKADILAGTYASRTLDYYPGNGDGTFGPKSTIATAPSGYLIAMGASESPNFAAALTGTPQIISSQTDGLVWNTGNVPAGDYRVHAQFTGGDTVLDAFAPFQILPDKTISSKITADKLSYSANQPVTITSTVTSQSANYILSNLTANISIARQQDNTQIYSEARPILTLVPGQMVELNTYWNTATNSKGTYAVTLQVFDGANLLSTSQTTFEILGSSATGSGITGIITAAPSQVEQGKDEALSYSIKNNGNEDISNLSITVSIVNPDTQELEQTFSGQANAAVNTSVAGNFTSDTTALPPHTYLAILRVSSPSMNQPKTLASASFTVIHSTPVISLSPIQDESELGLDHTVTATVADLAGVPKPGIAVTFSVTAGPNAGAAGNCSANTDCSTDANGQVSFTYPGLGPIGTDQIQACFVDQIQNTDVCAQAGQDWIAPTCGTLSSITSNFNGTAIAEGDYIWFNSVVKVNGRNGNPAVIRFAGSKVSFSSNGQAYDIDLPGSEIVFSQTATEATTDFVGGKWQTIIPAGYTGNVFLSGAPFQVPAGGLPGGINPVTWSGYFLTDSSGISVQWQWAAAVYTLFDADESLLGVKPVDSNSLSQYATSDHAGTAENYKPYVIGGARGGGGSNYTGSYSGTLSNTPCSY